MSITEEQTVSKQSLFVRPAGGQAQKLAPIALTEPQRAATFMALSLLLDYPDEKLWSEHLAAVQAARTEFPPAIWDLLSTFIAQAQEMGNRALCEHYVETFDRRRKCCLYLSYYAVGDTRHRGAALLSFKKLFSAAGWELETSELPDYLPVVLEFCARSQDVLAQNLLVAHQDGIEVLRSALEHYDSLYRYLLEALCLVLPEIDPQISERIMKIITAGPPTEVVGVTDSLPFPTSMSMQEN